MTLEGFGIPKRYDMDFGSLHVDDGNREVIAVNIPAVLEKFEGLRYEEVDPGGMGRPATMRRIEPKVSERGMFLKGEVGTGKTTLLGALAGLLDDKGVAVAWASYSELLDRMADHDLYRNHLFDRLGSVPALFVDEIGQSRHPEFIRQRFMSLISRRYDYMLPLFSTTNLTDPELKEAIGEKVISRLGEMCETTTVLGGDRRREGHPRPRPRVPKRGTEEAHGEFVGPDDPTVRAMLDTLAEKLSGKIARHDFADRIESLANQNGSMTKGLASDIRAFRGRFAGSAEGKGG